MGDRYPLPSVAQVSEEAVHINQHLHLFDRFEESESKVLGGRCCLMRVPVLMQRGRSGPVFTFAST